ncbi:MAG: type II toxin-antitoxin system prevent-host-death family antitoxin [Micromonosporaceae bacterium]|nr:type II toxin-antitoxin system prevent-host-death family antitoxin [Micromonosporaceae bacterium]
MRTLTATEASRGFAALLDRVEHGETVLITRDGQPVARVEPETVAAGARVLALFAEHRTDPDFADDLESAHVAMRDLPGRVGGTTA